MYKLRLTVRVVCVCVLFPGLFNMRGNDIPYNPFFYSYTLLTMDEIWYVHQGLFFEHAGCLSNCPSHVSLYAVPITCTIGHEDTLHFSHIFLFFYEPLLVLPLEPHLHIYQAVCPQGPSDGWIEVVPELLLRRVALCAAKRLRHRPRSSEDVCGQAWS